MLRRVSDGIKCFDGFQTASNASTGFRRHRPPSAVIPIKTET
ncbi:hypothetical protein [Neisseria benedictiae]|nr:hypothetical protein [Neisseria benedictiae]